MKKVANFIDLVQRQQCSAATRQLLVLSGSRRWIAAQLDAIECDFQGWLMITDAGHDWPTGSQVKQVSGKQAHQVLGQEFPGILFDGWSGFNPNGFGQVCGTLLAGGVMLLLLPELDHWPAFEDPEKLSMITGSGSVDQVGHRFIKHLIKTIREDIHLSLLEQGRPLPTMPSSPDSQVSSHVSGNAVLSPYLSRDQARVVTDCVEQFNEHKQQVAVITADRGRGKSAALGLIAAELMQTHSLDILVTAPGRGAISPLWEMVKRLLPTCEIDGNVLTLAGSRLRFVLPDQLLSELPEAQLLLVDEAAAIPAPVLRSLLNYRQVIYASTIHGYEGTGQGFAVRFLKQLDTLRPDWRHLRMMQPIRWAEGDPLEAFCYKALLLDAEPAVLDPDQLDRDSIRYSRLNRDQLASAPEFLRQLFGLLILAHYRTTPGDLRILLDSPNIQVWAATTEVNGQRVPVATALLAEEGPIEPALAEEIMAGRRRPKGQLIPQTLLAHSKLANAAGLRGLRVMRIAVQPELQHRGIGSELMGAIQKSAVEERVDWIGTSFGLTTGLLKFWQSLGMALVRVGHKRDKVSATHAGVMLKGLNRDASELQQSASRQCRDYLAQEQAAGSRIAATVLPLL